MKLLRDCALLLLLAAVPGLLSLWLHPKRPTLAWTKPSGAEVELGDVQRWPPPILWVDARPAADYGRQHIPGAISLNEDSWEQLLPGFLTVWQPGTKVIVYCDSQKCDASKDVARRIQRELNLTDIYVLKGGWATWQQSKN